jgi:hypothetical protein
MQKLSSQLNESGQIGGLWNDKVCFEKGYICFTQPLLAQICALLPSSKLIRMFSVANLQKPYCKVVLQSAGKSFSALLL